MVKNIIGVALIILGVILGLYVGLWLCFIGGITDLVEVVKLIAKGNDFSGLAIGVGVAKIIFASLAGYISAIICILPGWAILD